MLFVYQFLCITSTNSELVNVVFLGYRLKSPKKFLLDTYWGSNPSRTSCVPFKSSKILIKYFIRVV